MDTAQEKCMYTVVEMTIMIIAYQSSAIKEANMNKYVTWTYVHGWIAKGIMSIKMCV